MSIYSIRDLERISGTKAHTLRIWEQRYQLLVPARSETNVRYYDDDQLKKLLNVCTLLQGGLKISNVSRMSKQEVAQEIDKLLDSSANDDARVEAVINQLLIAAATFDTSLFSTHFDKAVEKLGWDRTYEQVIYPLLVRTGLLWMKDDLLPSQEHFLSNLVRQKLFAALDALPPAKEAKQKWLLFLNEEEDHEIGLLFANFLIRKFGQDTVYLGARVPYADLAKVIAASKPTHIYSFFVGLQFADKVSHLLSQLSTDFDGTEILVSGRSLHFPENVSGNRITYVQDIRKLTEIVSSHAI